MQSVKITRKSFLEDIQGRTFSDVVNDPEQPFDTGGWKSLKFTTTGLHYPGSSGNLNHNQPSIDI